MGYQESIKEKHSQDKPHSIEQSRRSFSDFTQTTNDLKWVNGGYSPRYILTLIIGGIALAEVIAMIIVYFAQDKPYYVQVLLDIVIMTVIIFPLLYLLSFKPLLIHIQEHNRAEKITETRLRLMEYATNHTVDELLQFILDEFETLTSSSIGFMHYLEPDEKTLWLKAWSTNTLQSMCKAQGKDSHYDVEQAGVWADAVRYRQPVIHNDYASLSDRKGLPGGHAPVIREMVVPTLRNNRIVAIVGLGNKAEDYTSKDVELITEISDFAWDIVERKQAENALRQSEEKFRNLVNWTIDWEKWMDPEGKIVYCSPSCERITGYSAEEFITDPDLLINIIHPEDRRMYEEHHQLVHDASIGSMTIEYRIHSREGSEIWIEHICRPLYGADNIYLGRRISNRDITERKQDEQKIIVQNQKEKILTQTIQDLQVNIARDLHDTLGQNISYLRMTLEHLSESELGDLSTLRNQLHHMTKSANEAYELIRTMLAFLKSGNFTNPISLFVHYSERIAERSSFVLEISNRGTPKQLSPHQIHQLFYIIREALSNVEKYAKADRVSEQFLWEEQSLTLLISDNGCGFEPGVVDTNSHFGLQFMRQRAEQLMGSFSLESELGQGTKIKVTVPYQYELSASSQSN